MALFAHEADHPGDPVDQFLDIARDIAARGMRAQHHEQVGEAFRLHAQHRARVDLPVILQPPSAGAADIDAVIGAGDAVEAGGVDQQVELILRIAGPDALGRDALDRGRVDVHQRYVVLVVDLVIAALQRQAARAEAVVLRRQQVGDFRIVHALADLLGDEFAGQPVGFLVDHHVAEITHPDAETRFRIQFFPEGLAIFR